MPGRASGVRALPWARIMIIARVIANRVGEDISDSDRRRLAAALRRSKGDPRRLTPAERSDIVRVLRDVDLARLGRELAAAGVTGRLLRR